MTTFVEVDDSGRFQGLVISLAGEHLLPPRNVGAGPQAPEDRLGAKSSPPPPNDAPPPSSSPPFESCYKLFELVTLFLRKRTCECGTRFVPNAVSFSRRPSCSLIRSPAWKCPRKRLPTLPSPRFRWLPRIPPDIQPPLSWSSRFLLPSPKSTLRPPLRCSREGPCFSSSPALRPERPAYVSPSPVVTFVPPLFDTIT